MYNMASLHNFKHRQKTSWLDGVGNKIKNVAEIIGSVKGIYDVGRGLYTAVQAATLLLGMLCFFPKLYI